MVSRKMFVVFLGIAAILWVLSAGYVLAQPPEGAGPGGGPPGIHGDDPLPGPGGPGPGPGAQLQGPGRPGGGPPGMRRSAGVMAGPDGQVREFRSEGAGPSPGMGGGGMGGGMGGGGMGRGMGRGMGGGMGGGMGIGMGRGMGAGGGMMMGPRGPMGPGGPMGPPADPETRALHEKEQKTQQDVQEIVQKYIASSDKDEQAKLKTKLTEVTGEQFGIRQQIRELQVKRLEKELARIREAVQKRTENREQIIKRHVGQLLHENDGLEF